MASRVNEALMAVVDAVIEMAHTFHRNLDSGCCLPEEPCFGCRLETAVLETSAEYWEKESSDLAEGLEKLIVTVLPEVPAPMQKIALQKCKQKIDELIDAAGDEPTTVQ